MGLPEPLRGPANVEAHLAQRYPPGTRLVMERVADGVKSSGFAWHREADGIEGEGLRGITYVELDDAGKIAYVQEGYESIFKLDKLLELIFKAFSAAAKDAEIKEPDYEEATPTDASGIARYLWEVAYPGGAEPKDALRFFADDCVYEDFNYYKPFVGLQAVSDYINLLPSFPGVTFVSERISEGKRGVCLTWKVVVNGEDGPSGISFNEVDPASGKIAFAR